MSLSINPSATTIPPSSFLAQTRGYVQGISVSDPVARQKLLSGVVASGVTQPVWGGLAITEDVSAPGSDAQGNSIIIATTDGGITGFTTFDRGYNMLITPGNNVQTAFAGMSIPYYRLGSNARIPVLCSSGLITAVEANPINTQVQWDFTNNQLIPFASGTALNVQVVGLDSNSKVVSYNSGTGAVTWTTGSVAIIQI